jgi:hypothetical protein
VQKLSDNFTNTPLTDRITALQQPDSMGKIPIGTKPAMDLVGTVYAHRLSILPIAG